MSKTDAGSVDRVKYETRFGMDTTLVLFDGWSIELPQLSDLQRVELARFLCVIHTTGRQEAMADLRRMIEGRA